MKKLNVIKRLTNKQMQFIMSEMTNDIIFWQNEFNKALDALSDLDDKKRLHVLIKDKGRLINEYIDKTNKW